jgi:hypothetical protein
MDDEGCRRTSEFMERELARDLHRTHDIEQHTTNSLVDLMHLYQVLLQRLHKAMSQHLATDAHNRVVDSLQNLAETLLASVAPPTAYEAVMDRRICQFVPPPLPASIRSPSPDRWVFDQSLVSSQFISIRSRILPNMHPTIHADDMGWHNIWRLNGRSAYTRSEGISYLMTFVAICMCTRIMSPKGSDWWVGIHRAEHQFLHALQTWPGNDAAYACLGTLHLHGSTRTPLLQSRMTRLCHWMRRYQNVRSGSSVQAFTVEQARAFLAAACFLFPDNAIYVAELGRCCLQAGEHKRGSKLLAMAPTLTGGNHIQELVDITRSAFFR